MIEIQDFLKSIEQNIRLNYERINNECKSKIDFHNKLQDFIFNLAHLYECYAVKEFKYPLLENGKNGRIDVIWKKNKNIICAFEVDSSYRLKSINKLKRINAEHKIWVVYFNEKGYQKYDLNKLKNVINVIPI